MFKFSHNGLTLEAPTLADLQALREVTIGWIQQSKPSVAPSGAPAPYAKAESTFYADQFKALVGKRFRMTEEESALWGDNREGACKARMDAEGIPYISEGGEQVGVPSAQGAAVPVLDLDEVTTED